jgi:hypothetical protein
MQGNKADIFDNTTLPFIWFQFPPLLLSISTFPSSHTPFRYDFLIPLPLLFSSSSHLISCSPLSGLTKRRTWKRYIETQGDIIWSFNLIIPSLIRTVHISYVVAAQTFFNFYSVNILKFNGLIRYYKLSTGIT